MSGELGNLGSLASTMARLWTLETAIQAAAQELGGTLHIYRWWRPDMELPALWNWLTPGDVKAEGLVPSCRTVDVLRITVSIGVNPTAVPGEGDMADLAVYFDLARPILDAELYSRHPLGQRLARRRGAQTVVDQVGAAQIIALELPIEVDLHNSLTGP